MDLPVILAHGSLGIWDEIIFISIAAVFLVMMGISWLRSRGDQPQDSPPEAPAQSPVQPQDETAAVDRFRLE